MRKWFILFFVLSIASSCSDEMIDEQSNIVLTETGCNLNVKVERCLLYCCDNPINMQGISVSIYHSKEDAANDVNLISSRITGADGVASFSNIDCREFYIKVISEENGTYISDEYLNENASMNWHQLRFAGNYFYDNCDTPSNQKHISLTKPVVGQKSVYRIHSAYPHVSFTPERYIEDSELRVKILEQLTINSFLIEEKVDTNVYGYFFFDIPGNTVKNVWTFEDHGVTVSQYKDDLFFSFVWNLSQLLEEEKEVHFSFNRDSGIHIDMSNDNQIFGSGLTGTVEDYVLFDHEFSDLLFDRLSYMSHDGPLKYRIYNQEDGLVRVMQFYNGGAPQTNGFDLVLE